MPASNGSHNNVSIPTITFPNVTFTVDTTTTTGIPGMWSAPLTGVYQTGQIILDDAGTKAAFEAVKEAADRARREQMEAEDRLYELLSDLQARCDDWG